jgi:hypothetical protein
MLKTFFWFSAITASAECVNKITIKEYTSESILLKLHCCVGGGSSFDATYRGITENAFEGSDELLPELCQLAEQDSESIVTHGANWVRIWDAPQVSIETQIAIKQIRKNLKQYAKSLGIMEITFFCTELDKLAKHIENGEAAPTKSDFTYAGINYISGKSPAEFANDLRSAATAKRDKLTAFLATPAFKEQFATEIASEIKDTMNERLKGKTIKFSSEDGALKFGSEDERPSRTGMGNRQ